jgi:hypothetical protein
MSECSTSNDIFNERRIDQEVFCLLIPINTAHFNISFKLSSRISHEGNEGTVKGVCVVHSSEGINVAE